MDILELCDFYEVRENAEGQGRLYVEVAPETMYPAIVKRLQEVAGGEVELAEEILYPAGIIRRNRFEYTGSKEQVLAKVPADVWKDALTPRADFPALPALVGLEWLVRLGGRSLLGSAESAEQMLVDAGIVKGQDVVLRVARRAYALELALGWFQEAVRVKAVELCGRARAQIHIKKNVDYRLV